MKRRFLFLALGILVFFVSTKEAAAVDYITSSSCTGAGSSACNVDGCFVCNGTTWVPQALIVGAASTCDASHAGLLQYTASSMQYCNGTSWASLSSIGAPNAFSFTNQTNVATSSLISSNAVTLAGFTGILPAVCTGCTSIARNGVWGSTSGEFLAGDTIALQLISSTATSTAKTATVTVGTTTSGTWSVTTAATAGASAPPPFNFTDQTNVNLGSTIISNAVTLGTFSGTATATCGTGCTNIAQNGVWAGATTLGGFIQGNTIAITQVSSSSLGTPTTATVSVGPTTSGTWTVTTATVADPCNNSPAIGTTCSDGTLYAGLSPDGNVPMYITPCDAGMSYSGGACTGNRTSYTWNDGSGNFSVTGIQSTITGKANTAALVALGTSPSPAPYNAARYCGTLSANGRGDWYLPAQDELNVIWHMSQNGMSYGFGGANYYWSSSEQNQGWASFAADWQLFSTGNEGAAGGNNKNGPNLVRCARHN